MAFCKAITYTTPDGGCTQPVAATTRVCAGGHDIGRDYTRRTATGASAGLAAHPADPDSARNQLVRTWLDTGTRYHASVTSTPGRGRTATVTVRVTDTELGDQRQRELAVMTGAPAGADSRPQDLDDLAVPGPVNDVALELVAELESDRDTRLGEFDAWFDDALDALQAA